MKKYKYSVVDDNENFEFESDNEYPDIDCVATDAAEDYYSKGDNYPNGSHYQSDYPKDFHIYEKDIANNWVHVGVFEVDTDTTPRFIAT